MQAEITDEGLLIVNASNGVEGYALRKWYDDNSEQAVLGADLKLCSYEYSDGDPVEITSTDKKKK